MQKHYLIILILIVGLIALSGFIMSGGRAEENKELSVEKTKTRIAVCPTYSHIAESLNAEYNIINTQSTAESLKLLNENKVDYVLSGRPLKPNEGDYKIEFIAKSGYSFISQQEKIVSKNDFAKEVVCSDLNVDQIKNDLGLNNIKQITNIAECPSNGIIVTSWDKTDYSQTNIVHILNNDSSRHTLSRTPILYCKEMCPKNIINQIKIAYEK